MKTNIKVYQGQRLIANSYTDKVKGISIAVRIHNKEINNCNYCVIYDNGRTFIGMSYNYLIKIHFE